MAIFKETVGTIRGYLLLSGLLGFIANVSGVVAPGVAVWFRLLCLPGVLLSSMFFYLGVTYETRIRETPSFVLTTFRAAMALAIFDAFLEVLIALVYSVTPMPFSLIGFLIAWYLHSQSKLLIREAAVEAQAVPGP